MEIKRKPFNDILASFMLLTRLPLWKVVQIPNISFKRATDYWSLVGWLTGGVMALVYWLCTLIHLPNIVAVIFSLISRLFLTGAFHEDGLGDFFDGFGAGGNKERILAIMKDSHIGSYGILAFICYYALAIHCLASFPIWLAIIVLCVGDPLCKMIGSQLINTLPYARTQESSKIRTVYKRMSKSAFTFSLIAGLLPLVLFMPIRFWPGVLVPTLVFLLLQRLMKKKIGGYTGDCCGATFLLCELSFWITTLILYKILG